MWPPKLGPGNRSTGKTQTPRMVHSHTVHLPLGALLSACTMCGTGKTVIPLSHWLPHADGLLTRELLRPTRSALTVHSDAVHLPSVHCADSVHRVWAQELLPPQPYPMRLPPRGRVAFSCSAEQRATALRRLGDACMHTSEWVYEACYSI